MTNVKRQFEPDCCRTARFILKTFFLALIRISIRLRYEGLEHVPKQGAFILVANHTSMADIIAIHTKLKRWLHWVAKKELFQTPIVGFFMPRMGAIAVDRDKVDLTAARGIFSVLQAGRPIAIFPQGTRISSEQINQVLPKTGIAHFAVKTNALLVPVAIEGRFRLFGTVRLVIGEPFRLETNARQKYRSDELLDMSVYVMKRVYRLIGIDYQPVRPERDL